MKRGFLRIDDFPYSGEMYARYGCFKDLWMYKRFMQVVETCGRYHVIPEVMVSSHVLRSDGTVCRYDDAMPKTLNAMHASLKEGLININAHGMTHINAVAYIRSGVVDAREFVGLREDETREHLLQNITFIREVFGKEPRGFVAPAWGYQEGVTKKVASEYFSYIADSYDSWKKGMCMDFGTVDPTHGFVHFPETWRYGTYSPRFGVVKFWEGLMRESDIIHMMQHGFRIPGKWKAAITPNPIKAMDHLLYGSLAGVLEAASRVGVEWGSLEAEAIRIRESLRIHADR